MRRGSGYLFVFTWVALTAAAYAFILTRDERGTSMTGLLLAALGVIGGAASLLNALAIFIMLMSGLMIFNAHPRLYWGEYGANFDSAWFEIGSDSQGKGMLRVGGGLDLGEKAFAPRRLAEALEVVASKRQLLLHHSTSPAHRMRASVASRSSTLKPR